MLKLWKSRPAAPAIRTFVRMYTNYASTHRIESSSDGELPREAERAGRARVRRVAAIRGDRGLVRRRDAPAFGRALLPPGRRGAEPRDDDRSVPARLRPRG